MSTLPGNPHHTVVIDLLHPASPRLECNAPAADEKEARG